MSEPLSGFICNLGKVDTSRPVPVAGSYVATITKVESKTNNANTGTNLFVTFALDNGAQSIPDSTGAQKNIAPGFVITECCVMQQGDNPNQPDWRVKIANIHDAAMGTNNDSRPENMDLSALTGRKVVLDLKPEEDKKGDFGIQARIKKFKPAPTV